MNAAADDRPVLVRACLQEPVARTPVWFMRQAGRSLPEYRAARGDGSILSAIADAALSAELTLQPVRRYGVDAAIVFSDIVVPLHAIGFGVEVEAGRGPVVDRPFRGVADLARLRPFEPENDAPFVAETVRLVADELAGSGVRACAVCPGDVRTEQLDQEHEWGPTGGVPPEKAMSPDYLAQAIVGALDSRNPVVIVDKPHLRAVFTLWGGSRRLRLAAVHGAYKDLLKTS